MIRNILIVLVAYATATNSAIFSVNRSRRSVDTCGMSKSEVGLIVRGQNFPLGSFPWIVALLHTGFRPPKFFCGGTLISKTVVISAAHCILDKRASEKFLPRDLLAIFGAHDLNNPYEAGRILQSPKKIFIHDDWNHLRTSYDADISLLQFDDEKILFGPNIQPICLWDSENDPNVTTGVVTGWGKSEDLSKIHENLPKLISAPMQTNEECFLEASALADLSSVRTFCAGLKNGSGVCFGDSGGGHFIKVDGVYYLRGIISSSLIKEENCDISRNAIYTNVLKFRDWIDKTTGALSKVFCNLKQMDSSNLQRKVNACEIKQNIKIRSVAIGTPYNTSVDALYIGNNENIKFLPSGMGEKFPNLKDVWAWSNGIEIIRKFYFKGMQKVEHLYVAHNKITKIEDDSFKDLIKLRRFWLRSNLLETLDEKLFAPLVNLELFDIVDNKIKFLSSTIFRSSGNKLELIDLRGNICIDKIFGSAHYGHNNLEKLELFLKAKCAH